MDYFISIFTFVLRFIGNTFGFFSFILSIIIFVIFIIEAYILISGRKYRKNLNDFAHDQTQCNSVFTYVLIPCLNEALVIQNTVQSLLSTPIQNIKFIIIDDASEDDTAKIIHNFNDPRIMLIQRKKPHAQEGKGAALNYALQTVVLPEVNRLKQNHKDIIISVMDADSFVDVNYFKSTSTLFASNPDIQAVQSKVKIIPNTNGIFDLTHMQDLEFSVILNSMQGLRAKNANAALGGNGQFTRLSALDAVIEDGPWTSSLVEDFDLSTRLTLKNIKKIVHINDLIVFQSGVKGIGKLIRQRARWAHGNIQCNKFIPDVLKNKHVSLKGKLEFTYFLFKPWLIISEFFIIGTVLMQIFLHGIVASEIFPLWVNILMILSLFIINFLWSFFYLVDHEIQTLNKSKLKSAGVTIANGLYLSFFMIALNFSYVFALYRVITNKSTWDKTERTIL